MEKKVCNNAPPREGKRRISGFYQEPVGSRVLLHNIGVTLPLPNLHGGGGVGPGVG